MVPRFQDSCILRYEYPFSCSQKFTNIPAHTGSQKERRAKRQGWNKEDAFHVCITSYALILQDQHVFRRKKWKYLILDEAHHIKNFKSQRWQTLLMFNAKSRLLL